MAADGRKDVDGILVLCLAAGLGTTQAAKKAEVSTRTVRRRLRDEAFKQRVAETRARMIQGAIGKLAASAGLAVKSLRQLARSGEKEAVKVNAARVLLEFLFRGSEAEVLAREVEELRRLVEGMGDEHGNANPPGAEAQGGGGPTGGTGLPGPGGDPAGPRQPDDPGGGSPGRLAGGPTPLF
jgi:hypothetical protein